MLKTSPEKAARDVMDLYGPRNLLGSHKRRLCYRRNESRTFFLELELFGLKCWMAIEMSEMDRPGISFDKKNMVEKYYFSTS